ncbi:MAG: ybeY [Bacteroidetes bacterium]|nr:ybeY [Bacteroidota bacterium]
MAVTFNSQHPDFKLKRIANVKAWIRLIVELEKKKTGHINFVFTTDDELLKINQQYLKHDTYTDIITFDYTEGKTINGDIMISIDRVGDNAKKMKIDFRDELNRVIIHGILHLCGYKDKTKAHAEVMRKKENWALKKMV